MNNCGSCQYLRAVINEKPKAHWDFLCRHTNKVVDPFKDGTECTTYEKFKRKPE